MLYLVSWTVGLKSFQEIVFDLEYADDVALLSDDSQAVQHFGPFGVGGVQIRHVPCILKVQGVSSALT